MHRKFLRDSLICIIPCLIAAAFVLDAWRKYEEGRGGFKLGVDLVGGTILIYEVDQERERQRQKLDKDDAGGGKFVKTGQALAEAVKRRIDPDDVQNITVRPAGDNRIEVILPTGSHRQNASGKKNITEGEVAKVRRLIEQVGSLEFRIVANRIDDGPALTAAEEMFREIPAETLRALALGGDLPPAPISPQDNPWQVHGDTPKYQWVEVARSERRGLNVLNRYEQDASEKGELWRLCAAAREAAQAPAPRTADVLVRWPPKNPTELIYSRECLNLNLSDDLRKEKKYEYFILTRVSDSLKVDGINVTITAHPDHQANSAKPVVAFSFNSTGGRLFGELTEKNKPDKERDLYRQLAIILNGELISFPRLNAVISDRGIIEGDFDINYVNEIVKLLRSGALPATLKQKPVSENTIGPTLGADTIKSGTRSVGLAFIAILVFMVFYYRFAGLVACVALLANLLLTVGFMVSVNATFTLPGLAGLVLMLGMAVDANVLIYERLREERDRGANLQMAIRNAYERAFPTIIDTHLSSIFTAILLYMFGNDQLRGFGISLTAGLIISLFTSLFMTRLLFDICQKKHWLKTLHMLRILTRPRVDFMRIRHLMFATTGVLTILGLALFLARGEKGMNVDFVGGTVYSGQLEQEVDIGALRDRMNETRQNAILKVAAVERDQSDSKSNKGQSDSNSTKDVFKITYDDGETRRIELALGLAGETEQEKLDNLKKRASQLPDLSVEQNFLSDSSGDKSRFFTIRTTEKEPELVQAAVDRLFRGDEKDENGKTKSLLATSQLQVIPGKETWTLKFIDPVSNEPRYAAEAYIRTLLEREFRAKIDATVIEPFRLGGNEEHKKDGRYSEMTLTLSPETIENAPSLPTAEILNEVARQFNQRPQPERLETFDPTLAGETRTKAMWAILASWLAILLYLWFRFGNWTFGAAAVICLVHDLCFTLGAIAICHYLHDTAFGTIFRLQDFKIDFVAIAALLTLVGYSCNDTIVVFDRIREVRGKNPLLTSQMINDSVNQTLSRTILSAATVFLVVVMLYFFGGDGIHLFAYVMVVGVVVGTYSSIYVASPLLLIFGEGKPERRHAVSPLPSTRPAEATT
jgi:SecD/SecF fusion protein